MKRIFANSVIYAIGNAANSAALFLVIPYLVNKLTTQEYGAWSIFEIATMLANLFILAGLEVGLMRGYWWQADATLRSRIVGSTLITVAVTGAVITGAGMLLAAHGIGRDFPGAPFTLILVLLIGWSDALFNLILTVFRIREQSVTYITLSLLRLIAFAALLVGFIEASFGLIGALFARLASSVLFFLFGLFIGRQSIRWSFDRSMMRRVASYGLPLLPTNIAAYILLAADRYIMGYVLSLEAVAIYTFAYKVAAILDVLVTRPFAMDWAPRRFKIATQANPGQMYSRVLLFYLWIVITFALFVVAITPFLYILIAPIDYRSGMEIVPIILLAYIIYGLSYPLNVGIMLKDRTHDLPVIGIIAALSCLGLCIWWIPLYGISGAAWATVVSYTIWTGFIAADSLRLFPIQYPLGMISVIVGCGLLTYSGLWLIDRLWAEISIGAIGIRTAWVISVMGGSGFILWRRLNQKRVLALDHPMAGV
ncbi:MAG: oligosaccharide flippase family protein [Chloroflexus sp.]|nr:oligosaccharide flippase family protein [Chloroflexus sp.]